MKKRLVVAGLLTGIAFCSLSCCESRCQINQNKETIETQVVQETRVVEEVEEVEESKLALRINCGATDPYTDKAGNTWLADQSMDTGKEWGRR